MKRKVDRRGVASTPFAYGKKRQRKTNAHEALERQIVGSAHFLPDGA